MLDDYAFLASGLVDLFEATSDPVHLERAVSLATEATSRFGNPTGAWFLTAGADQEPLGRRMEVEDGVEPSGNAAMILVLERLAALTGRGDFSDLVRLALRRYGDAARQRGLDMAGWIDGALLDVGPFYELVIAGDQTSLDGTWRHLLPSWTAGVRLPASGPSAALERVMPTAAEKRAGHGALAYVCVRGSCKAPTSDPAALRAELLLGWTR